MNACGTRRKSQTVVPAKAGTQRWRIQIYNKLHGYVDPQFNI